MIITGTFNFDDGTHTRTVDPDASFTEQALEDFLVAIADIGRPTSIRPSFVTVTRDQVKQFGTPEALAQWDAAFPHNIVFTHGPSLSGEASK